MVMSSRSSASLSAELQAELDLFDAAISGAPRIYPWNPGDRLLKEDLTAIAQPLEIDDLDLGDRGLAFFQQLDTCMLYAQLRERFGAWVPSDVLEAIAERAEHLASGCDSLAEGLVACVEAVLPNWSAEDLQVLARPFAYAMRGRPQQAVKRAPWAELSPLERARLSLAIAHFTLSTLEQNATDYD